jgi:disulfide bond formation protein DsbB
VPRWQGLRVVAGDGAAVRLTTMKDGVRSIVTGVAFGLYLPGMELFLHFALQQGACDERQMLFEAIERLRRSMTCWCSTAAFRAAGWRQL